MSNVKRISSFKKYLKHKRIGAKDQSKKEVNSHINNQENKLVKPEQQVTEIKFNKYVQLRRQSTQPKINKSILSLFTIYSDFIPIMLKRDIILNFKKYTELGIIAHKGNEALN